MLPRQSEMMRAQLPVECHVTEATGRHRPTLHDDRNRARHRVHHRRRHARRRAVLCLGAGEQFDLASWTVLPSGVSHQRGAGMRRILAISLMLTVLPGFVTPALAQTIGIVLMHGKTGSPNTVIDRLAIALQGAGYGRYPRDVLVATAHL